MELAIETFDLTKSFGALTAVNKLNLQVEAGSIHGFLKDFLLNSYIAFRMCASSSFSLDEVILNGSCDVVAIMRELGGIENGQRRIQRRTRL